MLYKWSARTHRLKVQAISRRSSRSVPRQYQGGTGAEGSGEEREKAHNDNNLKKALSEEERGAGNISFQFADGVRDLASRTGAIQRPFVIARNRRPFVTVDAKFRSRSFLSCSVYPFAPSNPPFFFAPSPSGLDSVTRAITSISAATEYTIRSASFLNMLVDCREKLTGFWSKGRKSDYSWLECV